MLSFILTADVWFENMLLSVRTPFFLQLFSIVTILGNTSVVIGVTGVTGLCLLFSKHDRAYVAGLATAVIGAASANYIMKILIERARPSGLIPSILETSSSFPSGHATLAVALYGFVAYLLCRLYPKNAVVIVTLATLVILAIGFSRLYLGVHFPTDVLAGYLLGGLWLILGIKITALL
ncbi:MAG: phosphatase PAP2 family protein, partial [bacterium]|nr:phosphatase PAP2 family protein [bacterium]